MAKWSSACSGVVFLPDTEETTSIAEWSGVMSCTASLVSPLHKI